MRTQTEGLLRERRARYWLKSAARPLQVASRVLFPPDINVDPEWMVFLVFLVEFDVLSTTILLWGRAGSGPATESNPFMAAIVHAPFLHFELKNCCLPSLPSSLQISWSAIYRVTVNGSSR